MLGPLAAALLGKRCRFLDAGLGSTSSPTFIHSWAHASVGNNVDFETKVHKTFSQEEGKALQCRILYKLLTGTSLYFLFFGQGWSATKEKW